MESYLQWRDQKAVHSSYNRLAIEWKNVQISSLTDISSVFTSSFDTCINHYFLRYGELQGLNKQETAERYGKEQVHEWRRSYDIPPPNGESLEMCAQRAVTYFRDEVFDWRLSWIFTFLMCDNDIIAGLTINIP